MKFFLFSTPHLCFLKHIPVYERAWKKTKKELMEATVVAHLGNFFVMQFHKSQNSGKLKLTNLKRSNLVDTWMNGFEII